jgi:hypothetical protein
MAKDIALARQALCLLLALLAIAIAARSQSVAGEVRGFDGQPAAGIVVRLVPSSSGLAKCSVTSWVASN